ncbi:MAG: DUF3467 domain-containing protein [Paludibacteraceae bacterium]|nr:DUF3467 domain-containing protein [Paludibacteraceae bacterium]
MEEKKQQSKGLSITISPEVAEGVYSNLGIISHSSSEFIVDFVRVMPQQPSAVVKSRIILTPEHAKRLMLALNDNVRKYEAEFGEIKLHQNANEVMPPMLGGDA